VVYQLQGVDNIGVGRFKSPTSSRGLSPVYGVPLNFGCEEIEQKIFNDLAMIEAEFKNAESKIFADPLILRKGKEKVSKGRQDGSVEAWTIPENVFPIDTRGGQASGGIDIFSPAIRYSEYQAKLIDDMKQYEQQIGTDRGFLTPLETGAATATEIRRANASTIALIDKIHTAIKAGVEETLKADAVFLNVAQDLYSVKFDFFDAFEDADKQYERISSAVDRGTAEKVDEMQWLFPNLTREEIEEKLARISAEKQINQDEALERILNGGV
jgi:A118 family predicted phage portal protein